MFQWATRSCHRAGAHCADPTHNPPRDCMRNHPRHLLALLLSAGLLLLTACPSPEECGNGRVEGQEQCDDGNTNNTDSCSNSCTNVTPAVCGNGEAEVGEACDDGNKIGRAHV